MTDTSIHSSMIAKGLALFSFACIFYAYHHVGISLYNAWQTPEYSHGILIPFIALLIAWHRLTATRPAIKSSWWGNSVLLASGAFLLVGELSAFEASSEYGFILSLVGLSLAFLGTMATRILAPAFMYLIFAVPLPHLVYSNLSQNLQLISSTTGVMFLDMIGIPVFQEGNVIDLGGYRLQVAEACNGLRYLFPLMSFGYLVAYLLKDRMWKRLVIFFSTIPITIAMNSLRIAFIGLTVNLWGIEMAEGFVHEFEGWVVFTLCVGLLLAEVWLLIGIGTRGHFQSEIFGIAHGEMISSPIRTNIITLIAFVICALWAVIFGAGIIKERTEIKPPHPAFTSFPLVLGDWRGKSLSLESDVLQALQLSDYWLADYTRDNSNLSVNFYMSYYASQHIGSAAHTPSNCIPGGGWQIADSRIKTINLPDGESIAVSRLLIKKGGLSQLVYYWFDERGRNITETYSAKWYLLLDSITMKRTDGALIRLVTVIPEGGSEENAENRLKDFLAFSYPLIKTFVPGNAEYSNSLGN